MYVYMHTFFKSVCMYVCMHAYIYVCMCMRFTIVLTSGRIPGLTELLCCILPEGFPGFEG